MACLQQENRELRSVVAEMSRFLNQQRPMDALGRKRWERMKMICASTLRGVEVEPGEITCDFCGTTLAREFEF